MSRLFQLESFSTSTPSSDALPAITPAEIEAARLSGYDAGYKSGWDDALQQVESDKSKISEEFARNLRDLGFTYHEARAHVTATVEPLVKALIDAIFPRFAAEAVVAHILALVQEHADAAASQPVRLRISPQEIDAFRSILTDDPPFPMEITEEPALAIGQAQLVLGKSEYRVDISDVVSATQTALQALHESNERTLKHG